MHSNHDPISASRLEAYLDQTEESLAQQDEAELDGELIAASLKRALESQRYRADTLASVQRLFRLWLRAGEPAAALRVVDDDGAHTLAALPPAELPHARLTLAFWRLEALFAQGDAAVLAAELQAVHDRLAALPADQQYDNAWEHLGDQAAAAGQHALVRRCAQARHALLRAHAQRRPYQAWDAALLAIREAQSYAQEGDLAQASSAAARAIDSLAKAGPDQDLDHDDWLRAAHALVPIIPDTIAAIVPQIRARLPAGTTFFALRDFDVCIARLEAMTLHRQGALDAAIARAALARTILRADGDDRFSAHLLDWLVEAGQFEQAARLAFESVFHEREVSAPHGWRVARRALAEGWAGQPWWQLAIAFAGMADGTADVRDTEPAGESESAFVQRHIDLARAHSPANPAIDAVEALHLIKSAQDYRRALPLLEAAVRELALAHSEVVFKLWIARIHVHGVAAAMAMPFVPASNASSCYNMGVFLEYHLHEQLPEGVEVADGPRKALGAQYYELGLARFEAFVMSGAGNVRDGDAHAYSMLCNNLAIYYRYHKDDHAGALQLHRKGIAASPFSEHYQGVMSCHRASGDDAAMIDSADQLWHYSADHGYSRHDPTDYIDDVAAALERLGRHTEISIWLQRLDEWWTSVDAEDRAEHQNDYVRALVSVLYYMADTQPEDALQRLEPVLAQVPAAASPYTSRMAGHVLRATGQFERALGLYADALRHVQPASDWHAAQRKLIVDAIGECKGLQRAAQPWWKRMF